MIDRKRLSLLLIFGLAIAALVLLSAGLSRDLRFSAGYPLQLLDGAESAGDSNVIGNLRSGVLSFLIRAFLLVSAIFLPIAFIHVLLYPKAWRSILRGLGLLVWLLAIYVLMRERPEYLPRFQLPASPTASPPDAGPLAFNLIDHAPSWLLHVTTVALGLLIAAALVGAAWLLRQRARRPRGRLQTLAREAGQALEALQAGAGVRDTILRCYFEMERTVRSERGISRAGSMTPREFERRLAEAGLPESEVRRLIRLFEAVRYGTHTAGQAQEQQAIDCLAAIVEASRSTA